VPRTRHDSRPRPYESEVKSARSRRDEVFLAYGQVECARGLRALRSMSDQLRVFQLYPAPATLDEQRIWDAIRLALQSSARVSRVFWPSSDTAMVRAATLRRLANLPHHHILAGPALANHVERFDELLDAWLSRDGALYLPYEIIQLGADARDPNDAVSISFSAFDVEQYVVRILDQSFCLRSLQRGLEEVEAGIAKAWAD
jgi:hypothetical protein